MASLSTAFGVASRRDLCALSLLMAGACGPTTIIDGPGTEASASSTEDSSGTNPPPTTDASDSRPETTTQASGLPDASGAGQTTPATLGTNSFTTGTDPSDTTDDPTNSSTNSDAESEEGIDDSGCEYGRPPEAGDRPRDGFAFDYARFCNDYFPDPAMTGHALDAEQLVGHWRHDRDELEFSPDGQLLYSVDGTVHAEGTYAIEGSLLEIDWRTQPGWIRHPNMHWIDVRAVVDDTLHLEQEVFVRIEGEGDGLDGTWRGLTAMEHGGVCGHQGWLFEQTLTIDAESFAQIGTRCADVESPDQGSQNAGPRGDRGTWYADAETEELVFVSEKDSGEQRRARRLAPGVLVFAGGKHDDFSGFVRIDEP